MRVKIGNYPSRLICNIHTRYMNKKYGGHSYDNHMRVDRVLEAIEDAVQSVYNVLNWLWFDKSEQKVKVHIDRWDTWSMDSTLAPIILPMLLQLKATSGGAPGVYPEDVPAKLRPTKKELSAYTKQGKTDDKYFARWEWVMDEMIWAFEQKCRDHWEDDYYGDYIEDQKNRPLSGRFEWTDGDGRMKHQERMSNGFKLFGKYFENLWD